jgi:type I restriction enzyme S subunit
MIKSVTKFRETEIGTIPEEWDIVNIGSVFNVETGKNVKTEERLDFGKYEILGANGRIGYTDNFLFDGEYILTGRVGTLGELYYRKDKFWPSDNVLCISKKENSINLKFLFYYLKTLDFQSLNRGSTQPLITQTDIKNYLIPLPDDNEQSQIAEILSSLDDKIELNRQINANLEKLASSLFKQWFGNTKISEKWPIATISDIVTKDKNAIVDGPFGTQMKISEYMDNGIPVIEMGYLEGYPFYKPFKKYISEEKYEEVKRSTVRSGDLVISKTGTLGLLGIMTDFWDKAILVSRLAKITPDTSKINRYYLFQILKNFQKEKYWDMQSSGSTMPIVNLTHIKSAELILPPIDLQNKFGDMVENFYKIIHKNLFETQNLSQIRDSLLPRLMSGKIRA